MTGGGLVASRSRGPGAIEARGTIPDAPPVDPRRRRCIRGALLHKGIHSVPPEIDPAALKDDVTTPAGCTIAGILALEDGRIRSVLSRAVEVASVRAGELASGK